MGQKRCSLEEIQAKIERHGASGEEAETVLSRCFEDIIGCFNTGRAFLQLYDAEKGDFVTTAGHNVDTDHLFDKEFISVTILKKVTKERQPVLTMDAMEDPRFTTRSSIAISGLRSVLCAPVNVLEGLVGIFYMDNNYRRGVFSRDDVTFLEAVLGKLAAVVKKIRPDIRPKA
ncbi:MAG: GAF domain-containing protein [Candidatus Eremiobacteraeota bacterium]|nr:GAF domain-containing protein [Candidatus Eremiobacteraeota bacterium]